MNNEIFLPISFVISYIMSNFAAQILKTLRTSMKGMYNVVGLIDDNPNKKNYIISGKKKQGINEIIEEYTSLNPAIETYLINNSKHLPQIEQPEEFVNAVNIYLS